MKIRTGFISNSSSSSFVIATKSTKDQDLLENIKDAIIIKNHPLSKVSESLAVTLYDCIQKNLEKEQDIHDYFGTDDEGGLSKEGNRILELFREGWEINYGYCTNDADSEFEIFLHQSEINFDGENIKILKEAD